MELVFDKVKNLLSTEKSSLAIIGYNPKYHDVTIAASGIPLICLPSRNFVSAEKLFEMGALCPISSIKPVR